MNVSGSQNYIRTALSVKQRFAGGALDRRIPVVVQH